MNFAGKGWVNIFLAHGDWCEGFQRHSITPYIHIMVYHVPSMLYTEVWQPQPVLGTRLVDHTHFSIELYILYTHQGFLQRVGGPGIPLSPPSPPKKSWVWLLLWCHSYLILRVTGRTCMCPQNVIWKVCFRLHQKQSTKFKIFRGGGGGGGVLPPNPLVAMHTYARSYHPATIMFPPFPQLKILYETLLMYAILYQQYSRVVGSYCKIM